jgi:hypothetical protein
MSRTPRLYARWPTLLSALLLALAGTASAQTIYRCGADGRDYRQTPCPGGQAVDVADPRSEPQRQAAEQLSQREAALGQQLRQERQDEERRATARERRVIKLSVARQARTHTADDEEPRLRRRAPNRRDQVQPTRRTRVVAKADKAEAPQKATKPRKDTQP